MHADGRLERLAQQHGVGSAFLEQQRAAWVGDCSKSAQYAGGNCLLPPRDNQLQATLFAVDINALEARIMQASGLKVTLFMDGVMFSLLLVLGAVLAMFGVAAGFGAVLSARSPLLRWPALFVLMVIQSTPLILLMILAAVLMLGLYNGSNAGQAVAEAMVSLKHESPNAALTLSDALSRASAQLVAFMVHATRGSPAASVIGVPELLSALADIASFSSERITTYTLLLVFYMSVVAAVVWLGNRWVAGLQRRATRRAGAGNA